jgi:hypothetical protein
MKFVLFSCLFVLFITGGHGVAPTRESVMAAAHDRLDQYEASPVNATKKVLDRLDESIASAQNNPDRLSKLQAAKERLETHIRANPVTFEKSAQKIENNSPGSRSRNSQSEEDVARKNVEYFKVPGNKAALHTRIMSKIEAMEQSKK